jgi:CheY-like chemotaxis protein/HAMP domain-containing protein
LDIRTKLILALVSTSLISMLVFGYFVYQFSAEFVANQAGAEGTQRLLEQLIDTGLSLAAVAILGGVVLGILLARQIRKLAETVDRIRHGELDLRAQVVGEDEVALLARSLNEFMDQLNRSGDIFQLGELRVLLVEDNLSHRHLIEELLGNWRMQAVAASDCEAAVKAIRTAEYENKPVQLVVLDADMPALRDAEFVDTLLKLKKRNACPVILLTEDPDGIDLSELEQVGAVSVLPAPVVASDLMQAILEEMGVSAAAIEDIPDVFLKVGEGRRVLLAEDSNIIQKVTVGFLENWGHAVTVAANGKIAVKLVQAQSFDLVLMDLEMPEMGGIEATETIRGLEQSTDQAGHNRLPIVALTAKATKADREMCMAVGMDDYIAKPIDPKVLYRLVSSFPVRQAPPIEVSELLVDWEVAARLTGGDEDLLKELTAMFPVESAQNIQAITTALQERDAEALTRAAHTLKSSARLFGAQALVASALAMEESGQRSCFTSAQQNLPQLKDLASAVIAELAQYKKS